ncbi:hypothetical protein [Tropicibacter oceani]|uniref:Uncharacterized protein n=1 Tax=Tropicibacter oceani TaxID=3058420 RepID=A0ABY8QDH7_9RHOB|nr:hypothetical protein [Tropicibacter oceani]WGW02675.1 hypothetical protein QF118_12080 [Tropicibacter oceani]
MGAARLTVTGQRPGGRTWLDDPALPPGRALPHLPGAPATALDPAAPPSVAVIPDFAN